MNLNTFINRWKSDPSIAPNITSWQVIPPRQAQYVEFPDYLEPKLLSYLKDKGIHSLYKHQHQALEKIRSGDNIALVTGTSSGKTLAFTIPIINHLLINQNKRALFLYPTKALAHDQLSGLGEFPDITASAYDGDTPQHHRPAIRNSNRLIISNPDMLHLGILPYHTNWDSFFSNLAFVVIDEMHSYRGIFGSHVANIIRRMKRIAANYGSRLQFILTSATIGNPQELAESLVSEPVSLIMDDHSSRGEKQFLIYNPPVVDQRLGLRASMQQECVKIVSDLVDNGFQTILFGRSRKSIEFMLTKLRDSTALENEQIYAYRSGYLANQRRKIEAGLKTGTIRAVTATTALELGVDIGGLDAAILAGYPGTIAAAIQQAGRSGRSTLPSLSMLVASSTPLDQYIASHPEFLLSSNPESVLIDPDNLLIVLDHLHCAAYELPFKSDDKYGKFTLTETKELLDVLYQLKKLHFSNNTYYWMSDSYPAVNISLRSISSRQISLEENHPSGKKTTLGTIDYNSALWMVHPGAIYLHQGDSYFVQDLDLETNKALLNQVTPDYYTEPERSSSFSVERQLEEKEISGSIYSNGEIKVISQVTGYKKIFWSRYEVISREVLDLPETELATTGFWLSLSDEIENFLEQSQEWNSSPNDYGKNWQVIRKSILERDQNRCQICGKSGLNNSLHVHHKKPLRSFNSLSLANQPDNLISLCPVCHQKSERVVKVNSGIHGLGYVLHSLAPLYLMCDSGDIGFHTDFQSPIGAGRPTVLLYENFLAGIGYSKMLFNKADILLTSALDLVQNCACLSGCPSCVGPGGEQGSGGKSQTLAILRFLCKDLDL